MLRLALAYFTGIFLLGFALGTLRTLWLEPRFGNLPAVALELPFMLVASLLWARRLLAGRQVSQARALAIGGLAFGTLMLAEAGLSMTLGDTLAGWFHSIASPAGALGLAGQIGFALMPWFAVRRTA